jgi:lipopolysaccharide transport system permease protein
VVEGVQREGDVERRSAERRDDPLPRAGDRHDRGIDPALAHDPRVVVRQRIDRHDLYPPAGIGPADRGQRPCADVEDPHLGPGDLLDGAPEGRKRDLGGGVEAVREADRCIGGAQGIGPVSRLVPRPPGPALRRGEAAVAQSLHAAQGPHRQVGQRRAATDEVAEPVDQGSEPLIGRSACFLILTSVEQLTQTGAVAADVGEGAAPETIRLQATRGFSRVLSPPELWRYREVAFQIARRDITVRYRQTLFGAAWAVLQPVAFMVVFTLVFGNLAGVSSEGLPYPLFSLAALVPWTFFANAVVLGSDSLVTNAPLVSKIYFPRIFIPAGVVAAGLLDLAISLVILFVIVLAWGVVPPIAVLALPLLVVVTVATALGICSALSAINVRYRDVRYVVPFAIQLWLFATPIAYSSSEIDEPWRTLSAINPMTGVVEGFRWAVLGADNDPGLLIAISAACAALVLIGGLAYFDRVERRFADII